MYERGDIVQVVTDEDEQVTRTAFIIGFDGDNIQCQDIVTHEKFLATTNQLMNAGMTMDEEF